MRNARSIEAAKTTEVESERWHQWLYEALNVRAEVLFEEGEGRDVTESIRLLNVAIDVACGVDPDEARIRMAAMLFDAEIIKDES